MMKLMLATCAAAVALSAAPAEARHITGPVTCAHWRHGHCVAFRPRYNVGYVFGPRFGYVDVATLPAPIVTRYNLGPRFRYVHQNGYIYVVNPRTYRVVRVIPEF
jgi:hypothetical protein